MERATVMNVPMKLLREYNCQGCNEKIQEYESVMLFGPKKGNKTTFSYGCKCEDNKLAREAKENSRRNKFKKMLASFEKHSLISPKLKNASMDNFNTSNESLVEAYESVKQYIEGFYTEEGLNLFLWGAYGSGKSHLAKSVSDEVMKEGYSSIFISVPKLLTKIKSSYDKDAEYKEQELIDALSQVDLLILDDIGAESNNRWANEKVFEIVDSRQGMNTIYTSNLSPGNLLNEMGERNGSRILDDAEIVEFDAQNYRLRRFQ